MKEKESFLSAVGTFVLAIIIALLIRAFVFNTSRVDGSSMFPTLEHNQRLICLVFPRYYKEPTHGEVVVFQSPIEKDKQYIKRMIGLPGDTVELVNGDVYLNGKLLNETYIESGVSTLPYTEQTLWELGEGEYFVMGDNRQPGMSVDSRYFGPISKKDIKSYPKVRFWPLSKFQFIGGSHE